ncbi:DUF748 domain-containing protein [Alteromonas stellipolaris]|uniref:DUF748 domain-containing protein n=1 Tax=Alteromonas stellipolaris TaxID=233316 RepID=A0AAW7Z5R0_9ALTE|nr:DUF748 domain-containing protein [Alteromonas stellipolaris]MDO6534756.1 DUF748 domain-containing protein [Alteromonas stellipolaris]MDO6578548.1 DUF748 domain-containing protein [Alteromonas stellipolaris]MDO6626633.1 DUF748 domain-containing protein [Alteromonas stellipolaris]
MPIKNLTTSFKQQPKWRRIATYFLLAYLFYALILGLIAPLVLESKAPKILSEKLGRNVSIDSIRINPFLLRARVSGFSIEEASSDEAFIAFTLLELDVGFWQTLFSFTPTLEHFYLNTPYAHIARVSDVDTSPTAGQESTVFNFSDIIDTLAKANENSPEPEAQEQEQSEIPHIRLGEFRLSNGHISVADHVTDTQLDYPELSFTLTNLDTLATGLNANADNSAGNSSTSAADNSSEKKSANHYAFTLATNEGGSVQFDGQFQLSPIDIAGSFEVSQIALAPLWPLSDDVIDAKITDGVLSFSLNYHLSEDNNDFRFQANDAKLSLSHLVISDKESPRIKLAELRVSDINLDTKTQQVDVDNFSLQQPWISAQIDKSGVDLVSIFTPKGLNEKAPQAASRSLSTTAPSSTAAAEASPTPSDSSASAASNTGNSASVDPTQSDKAAWRVILQEFALNDGDIIVQESMVSDGVNWRIFPLNVSTGVIDSTLTTPIDYAIDMKLGGSLVQSSPSSPSIAPPASSIGSKGTILANEQAVSGTIDVSQFALSQLQPYVGQYLNLALKEGSAVLSGSFEADSDSKVVFNGQADIASLTIIDGLKQEPLLQWADFQAKGIEYSSTDSTFSLEKITLDKPYAKLLIAEDKQTNFSNIVVEQTTSTTNTPEGVQSDSEPESNQEAQPASTEEASELVIRIQEIVFNDGSAYFADNSLRPRFASGIESLNGSITKLSSNADTAADVDIKGKIDGYAPVALYGSINPLIEDIFLNLTFTVEGAELTSVNPYSGTYMGHFIDKGLLSLDIQYLLENNQLAGNNHVVIDQLTLGRKTDSDQALSLPLGLAIALLEDSNGVIDLGLEVSGDLDSPTFGFGSIILKAIGNLITKAVTAPFSLLANLVGSDDDELNEIDFTHGSSQLTDTASSKLATLADALSKRPGLRVNIEGTVDEVPDAYELAEQKLQQQLLALSGQETLPVDLSPSTMPVSGPLADALSELFINTTGKTVEEERVVVIAKLQQNADGEGSLGDTREDTGNSETTPTQVTPDASLVEQALYIAMYNQVRSGIDIPKRELAHLADARAKTVKNVLANDLQIDANRLFLLNSRQHLQLKKSGVALTLEAN